MSNERNLFGRGKGEELKAQMFLQEPDNHLLFAVRVHPGRRVSIQFGETDAVVLAEDGARTLRDLLDQALAAL